MKRFFTFLKHEFLEMLPPTIYFFVVLHIVLFARNLLANEWGIEVASSAVPTIGALIHHWKVDPHRRCIASVFATGKEAAHLSNRGTNDLLLGHRPGSPVP